MRLPGGDEVTFGSLFSGIGGLDLGLERAGMKCKWQVEIDPFCQKVLAKHWPEVKRYGDIAKTDFRGAEPVDLLAGGFPCQDVSHAGLRIGINGSRSGLWAEFARAISEIQPKAVLVENVPGLLNRGFDRVLGDLAKIGFDAEWACVPACSFGAPHPRERLFIVAYAEGERQRQLRRSGSPEKSPTDWNLYWPKAEPGYPRVLDGVPDRVDRLKSIGNAVVPQVAEYIGRRIMEAAR